MRFRRDVTARLPRFYVERTQAFNQFTRASWSLIRVFYCERWGRKNVRPAVRTLDARCLASDFIVTFHGLNRGLSVFRVLVICCAINGRTRFGKETTGTRHDFSIDALSISWRTSLRYLRSKRTRLSYYQMILLLRFRVKACKVLLLSFEKSLRLGESNTLARCNSCRGTDDAEEQTTDEITTGCAPFSFVREEQPERRRSSMLDEASLIEVRVRRWQDRRLDRHVDTHHRRTSHNSTLEKKSLSETWTSADVLGRPGRVRTI